MTISAKDVMSLREKTGAGMMDCKKALESSDGNIENALDLLREKGLARARKRSEKSANEGLIQSYLAPDGKTSTLLELNSETDFVARTPEFIALAEKLCRLIAEKNPTIENWGDLILDGTNAKSVLDSLSAKVGEKLELRRFQRFQVSEEFLDIYIHGAGRLGVMLKYTASGNADKFQALAHEVSMQIAAANPSAIDRNNVDKDTIKKEKEIYRLQARNEGKPEQIIDKIADGKLNAYFKEVCLLEQPFIKEPKMSLSQHISAVSQEFNIKFEPKAFVRFALGGN